MASTSHSLPGLDYNNPPMPQAASRRQLCSDALPAIDLQAGSSHEPGLVAREEEAVVRDVRDVRQAAEGHLRHELLEVLLGGRHADEGLEAGTGVAVSGVLAEWERTGKARVEEGGEDEEADSQAGGAQEGTDGVDADLLLAVLGCETFGGLDVVRARA